jgi:ATP/maltotriose-dependent transcriptional regulator MalT
MCCKAFLDGSVVEAHQERRYINGYVLLHFQELLMRMKNVSRKILAPPLPPTLLYREQLSRVLAEALGSRDDTDVSALYHLVLLCAPAGYGKTTLLADTVKRLSLTCCWFFLDHSDQKCVAFLETLVASIRRRFPSFGPQLDNALTESIEQDETALQTFLDALITALASDIPEHVVLALCNYQEVNSSRVINNIVNQLLKRLPSQCLLVIESRALPDLNLAGSKLAGSTGGELR